MTTKYDHLKLKVFASEFKYVLLNDANGLVGLVNAAEKLPMALFCGDDEFSAIVPADIECSASKTEPGWVCLRIIGSMPFGTVQGLIAEISNILAKKDMGICVASTFLTDWFFIRAKNKDAVVSALKSAGWKFVET